MKKTLYAFLISVLFIPSLVYGIATSWDRYIVGAIRTLVPTDKVLIGGSATTTNAQLEVQSSIAVTGLTSALTLTGADGLFAEYAGTTCTNQFIRALSALGVATCASINNGDWSGADLSVTNGGTGLSTFGGTNTILYTTAADTLSSEAAFTYNPTANLLTFDYSTSSIYSSFARASTTALHIGSGQGYGYVGSNGLFGVVSTSTLAGNLTSNCATITGGAGLCDGVDDTSAGGSSLASSTPWTFGNIVTALTNGTVTTISTSTLVNNIFPFTSAGAIGTTTVFNANGGINATASSTFGSALRLSSLAQGYSFVGSTGLVGTISSSTLASNLTSLCSTITGSADLCDGSDATGGGGGSATSTVDWVIYKKGTDTVVYDTISNSEVLTTTTFGAACNYIVNAATSTFPARTDVAIRSGRYNAGADCVISGNSSQYSPQFNFAFNASTTEVYVGSGLNAFSFKDQAQVRIKNLTCGLGGTGNCLFASSSAGTIQSSVRESIFENIDAYATSTHTGWVVDFREDFRNKFTDFDWKFTANGYRSQNNYTNAQFINGDSTFERGFVELCDASVGIGYVFKLDGQRGQVNQNTFSDINGIDCEANGTVSMFYLLNGTRNRVENFNVEEVGTTTEIYGSSGSLFAFGNTFSSNKYKTTGNTSGVSFFTNANAFNNQYECWEEEVEGAVVLFRDLNTLDTQAPNAFGNFSGGVCRLNDNGGSVSMSTTTTSVVQSLRDNITGAFSYTNSVKLSSGKIFFNFQNGVTTFLEYIGSALRFTVGGTERLTISATGFGTTTVTGFTVNGSATSTSNVGFNISTGCYAINNVCVGGSGGAGTVTSVIAGVGFLNRGLNITGSGTLNMGIATATNPTIGHAAYWAATGDASNPATLTSIATSTPTIGASLSYSGTFGNVFGGSSGTLSLNMANANTWTALQTFGNSTTTYGSFVTASTTDAYFGTGQGIAYIGSNGRLRTTATSTFALSGFTNDLANLTALDTTLTFSGNYNGATARTIGLNLSNANTWTVNQTFNYSSSTVYSSFVNSSTTFARIGTLTLSTSTAGTLKVDANGLVWSDTSGGGAGYSTIQDEGSGLTVRSTLNFTGSGVSCADDAGNSRTNCTINAGAATAGGSDKQLQFNDATALGGASGLEWDKNAGELSLASGNTLILGATATSSTSQLEVIKDGILGWFASTTGATIRPIFHIFRNTTTGISGIGINSSSTEDALTINGFANFDPQIDGCVVASLGSNVTTDQLAGQFCDGMAVDSITDGGILQDTISRGTEVNMPFHTVMRTGDTTSWAANEGVWIKTQRALSATTTLMAELWVRTPNTNVSTTTGTYMFGLANAGSGSLTTTAAYANTTNMCAFQASSTANWIAIVKRDGTFNEYVDTGIATSTTQSTFRRFRIRQDYANGCRFYVDGVQVASETAANSPVGVMQVVWGLGNNGAGTGTVGTSQNHYFMYAEPKIGWGRWQMK